MRGVDWGRHFVACVDEQGNSVLVDVSWQNGDLRELAR